MTQSSEEGNVNLEVRGRILLIGIDRPKKLNAFSPKMLSALGEAYVRLDVNRRSNLTPYRRPILTPLSGGF
jgi:enoyl-CoA hydratase/carnithine racemase